MTARIPRLPRVESPGSVTTVYVSLGVLVAAAAAGLFVRPGLRPFLAAAVLIVPVALELPSTVGHDRRRIERNVRLSPGEAELAAPIPWPAYRNVPLLAAARTLIPDDATVAFLPGGKWQRGRTPAEARRVYLQSGWVRWFAFVIAPRVVVEGTRAPWVVVVDQTPRKAGIVSPRQARRFGNDWLVER